MDARYERKVTMTVGHELKAQDLATFLAEMERAGLDLAKARITWRADQGNQREPSTLRLEARP